jgi:hypothetical protein
MSSLNIGTESCFTVERHEKRPKTLHKQSFAQFHIAWLVADGNVSGVEVDWYGS